MKKQFIVKKNLEFNKIINSKKCTKNRYFIIYYDNACYNYSRFGISVGKKIGKAYLRNKYKRKIRMILSTNKKNYSNKYDYIIIMTKECLNLTHVDLEKNLNILMNKINEEDLK